MDNYFYLWTSSVSEKGVQKIRKAQFEHFQKLKDICKKEEGDKHIFLFGGIDSYRQNGLKKSVRSFLGIKTYPKILSGSKIFVPEKSENRNKTSVAEIVGYTTSLVSIIALIKSF